MTAMNLILKSDAAHVLTDGAYCGPAGEICCVGSKAVAMPHGPAVYLGRGPLDVINAVAVAINLRPTFDAMSAALATVVKQIHLAASADNPRGIDLSSDHLIAGWSDELQRFTARFSTTLPRLGHEEYTASELRGMAAPPTSVDLADDLDPVHDGLRILREQRGYSERGSTIGGHAQLTSVYRDRIETRILERWPAPVALAA